MKSIALGAIQGLTEFIPVSSSGHLAVFQSLLDFNVPLLFDVLLHIATLLVIVIVFAGRIVAIIRALFRVLVRRASEGDRVLVRIFLFIVLATIPTGGIGILLSKLDLFAKPRLVGIAFLCTAAVLLLTKRANGSRSYDRITWKDAVAVGAAQGLGVLPGISRSGITISSAVILGIDREKAGEFSFLLSIPAILGAFILEARDLGELSTVMGTGELLAGLAASFLVGLAALLVLLRIIRKGRLYLFSFYLVPAGILTLIFV